MKYSEKVLEKINNMVKNGEIPTVEEDNKYITFKYSKTYSEETGKFSTKFFYKVSKETKLLFGNVDKTHVVINHENEIDYDYYQNNYIPKEIVAIACGFKDYKDLKSKEAFLEVDEKDRIELMINGLIPITQEEYQRL